MPVTYAMDLIVCVVRHYSVFRGMMLAGKTVHVPVTITCERRWLTFKCLQTKASEWVADRDKLNQTTALSIQTLLVAKYKAFK